MFEELLYSHLVSNTDFTEYLTTYNSEPAVFNQKVPDDMDKLWGTETQYGRAVFYVNMQADAERKISGTLELDVHLFDTVHLEDVANVAKQYVDGYFFTGKTETIFAKWNATRYVDVPEKKITVAAIMFSLIAFPNQLTNEPDPIRLVNNWTRTLLPDVKLIGYDTNLPEVWKPTKESPAVYWRNARVYPCERIPSSYAGDWYTVQMYAHIFTVDIAVSNALATLMCTKLNQEKILKFSDGTWMRIDNNNQIQSGADELRVGQLSVEGDYCVLRPQPETELLKDIVISD